MKHDTTIHSNTRVRTPWLRPRPLAVFIAGTLAMLAAQGALAQQTESAPTAGADSEADDAATLNAIIVTAQKRGENIKEVPVSISVLSEQQLEDMHAVQISDFAGYLPGMQITPNGTPGQTSISLRGISSQGDNATVGTYIDDVPIGSSGLYARSGLFNPDLLAYDTQRIEVLRGPQGTLYGASTLGGLLKYITHDPDLSEFDGRMGGGIYGIGGSNGGTVRVGMNAPLIKDTLGLRASFSNNSSPGYTNDVRNNSDDVNSFDQRSGRIALLWAPNTDVSLKLSALKQSTDADNPAVVALDPVTLRPMFGDLDGRSRLSQPFEMDVALYAATLEWSLGWADFTSATSYSTIDTYQANDNSVQFGDVNALFGIEPSNSLFDLNLNMDKWTQEFRLASNSSSPLEWMLGSFHTREDSKNTQVVTQLTPDGQPVAGLDGFFVAGLPSTYKENALFANGTWKFNPVFDISAGVRFARNDQKFSQIASGLLADLLGASGNFPGTSSEDVTTWSLSSRYRLNDKAMLYARVATGYRPGGPNIVLPNVPSSVGADTLTNYEIGLKADFFDRRVYVDMAAFRMDWDNLQVGLSTEDGSANYYGNAGTAVSQGVEWSVVGTPMRDLRVGITGAYTDSKFTETVLQTGVFDGDRLPGVARWSGAVTADYGFELNSDWAAHAGAGWRWVGSRPGNIVGNPNNKAFHQVDLNADVSNGRFTVRLYVRNLTNELVYFNPGRQQNALTGELVQYNAVPLQPRTIGLEFDARF